MTQPPKDQPKAPGKTHPSPAEDLNKPKHQAEQDEIAGRHKNDGQKDHKGAR
jgi:hypothetical protein